MSDFVVPPSDDRRPPEPKHRVLTFAVVAAIVFVFGSASAIIAVAVDHCILDDRCNQLDGLTNVIMAWTGAIVAGAISYLSGGRRTLKAEGGQGHVGKRRA